MSLRTFTTLRDCDLKLWVDIIEQLTVKKFQPIALSQYCLFFILMYVEVPSFFQVTYNNLIINVLHIRYFPPEEEGSLMASRDWLYATPPARLYLFTVYIFVCPHINQYEKYHYILYLFMVYIFVCPPIN